ncbi:TauD/TfdA family dioxygenase [Archangium violaceum]|uniref:TauD/TfdA family dioxygenase n=1 Tax=Archangium violaceum TaxID=83451 RepID=UPI001950C012|nr:TauD/TfdA family dioxygenase [Archangium violaceum]QRN96003.1 TauD/TfdA family dioxygenase [Archangium violaceum]
MPGRKRFSFLEELKNNGWTVLDDVVESAAFLQLAHSIGAPSIGIHRYRIEHLSPTTANAAKAGTMSSQYGLGEFPLHTDTAHWPTPARYILLRSVGLSHSRSTIIASTKDLPFNPEQRHLIAQGTWLVSQVAQPFTCSVFFQPNEYAFRFDAACMRPYNSAAKRIHQHIIDTLKQSNYKEIKWSPGRVLIVDNWRMLHGRADSRETNEVRTLQRITIPWV